MRTCERFSCLVAFTALFTLVSDETAKAENFAFSFSNDNVNNPSVVGGVSGTVTGLIEGLPTSGTNVPASSVIILSFPSGLGDTAGLSSPITSSAWLVINNSFTISSGQIVNADLWDFNTAAGGSLEIDVPTTTTPINTLTLDSNITNVSNSDGLAGVVFTPVPVPEPASIGLISVMSLALLTGRCSHQTR
jgi:hypothetical protein